MGTPPGMRIIPRQMSAEVQAANRLAAMILADYGIEPGTLGIAALPSAQVNSWTIIFVDDHDTYEVHYGRTMELALAWLRHPEHIALKVENWARKRLGLPSLSPRKRWRPQ
jgi:hypothetical protein